MKIFKTILQTLLIAQFSFFGLSKIVGTADMVETFTIFGFPAWFMIFTGLVEVTAVISLALGFWKGRFIYAGAVLIAGLTIGAFLAHSLIEGNMGNALIPLVVLTQAGIMAWIHSKVSGQKVLQVLSPA